MLFESTLPVYLAKASAKINVTNKQDLGLSANHLECVHLGSYQESPLSKLQTDALGVRSPK